MIESKRTCVLLKFNGDAIVCQTVSLPSPKPWQNVPFVYNKYIHECRNYTSYIHIYIYYAYIYMLYKNIYNYCIYVYMYIYIIYAYIYIYIYTHIYIYFFLGKSLFITFIFIERLMCTSIFFMFVDKKRNNSISNFKVLSTIFSIVIKKISKILYSLGII